MEDILASIRRILAEEEAGPPPAPVPAPVPALAPAFAPVDDGVLQLDASMMLPDPVLPPPVPPLVEAPPMPGMEAAFAPAEEMPFGGAMLLAPEAAAAAATSVGSLMRTLTAERTTQVYSGGPTIEDIVRAELRPLLKQWLDSYLPGLVERLVRAEIERVVGRAAP
jgi:cell pole-organizing protein PopZ